MASDLGCAAGQERSQEREVAGGDDADPGVPGAPVDLLEVSRREPARADDDAARLPAMAARTFSLTAAASV